MGLKIIVNLSYKQLYALDLIEQILAILNQLKICPSYLKIEITEINLSENVEVSKGHLNFGDTKIELCLDNFGNGYSSLSYLHQFPFNVVKIDRSFIFGQQTNTYYLEIVKAIFGDESRSGRN